MKTRLLTTLAFLVNLFLLSILLLEGSVRAQGPRPTNTPRLGPNQNPTPTLSKSQKTSSRFSPLLGNLVYNGDFETPVNTSATQTYYAGQTIEGWAVDFGSIDLVAASYWQPASGNQSIDLNGVSTGALYQDLQTSPGQSYILSFYFAGNPLSGPQVKQMEIWWGSNLVGTVSFDISGHSTANMGWTYYEYPVVATASTTRLEFKSITSDCCFGPALDAVFVGVPVTYSISGRVADSNNNPISGVTISDGAGHTATTDSSGNYTLNGLAAGTYTLSATATGHKFWPSSQSIVLSGNVTQNFSEWTCSINVPLYLQTAAAWNQPNQTYAGSSYTIGQKGCALSSDAMLLSYFGQFYSPPFQTDPGALNTALLNYPNGFSDLNVNPVSFQSYARSKGVLLFQTGTGQDNSNERLKLEQVYLCTGNPVILQVPSAWSSTGTHFVVATGKTVINGQNTYTLNDPAFGQVTLLEKYNNHFTSAFYYVNELTASTYHRSLEVSAHSPVQLLVTDVLGHRVGYDPRIGVSYNEIPDAGYITGAIVGPDGSSLPDFKYVLIPQITSGPYSVQVIGTGSGPYTIDALQADSSGNISVTSQSGTAQPNSVNSYVVSTANQLFLPLIRR